jgi:hypothetical protein
MCLGRVLEKRSQKVRNPVKWWSDRHPHAARWVGALGSVAITVALVLLFERNGLRAHTWEIVRSAIIGYFIVFLVLRS